MDPPTTRRRATDRASDKAGAIASAILAGFDRHYALFRYTAQQARSRFEAADWHAIQRLARERIAFYDQRVLEAVERIASEFNAGQLPDATWQQVRIHYVGLLATHKQPELAETFFNSVSTKILHRTYFNNATLFVRPAVSTEWLDSEVPSYRAYYPPVFSSPVTTLGLTEAWRASFRHMIVDIGFACGFVDVARDIDRVLEALHEQLGPDFIPASDCQFHLLRSPFFRNKGAYLIGRMINDGEVLPLALPILQDRRGRLYVDALLLGTERVEALFNFARAYFMVDMDVPAAYVTFLRTLMPTKPDSEHYSMLGLQKQGKTMFYRDLLDHLRHSHDHFVIAPGIKGLVMLVFTLPSFPYVFKVIKDRRDKDISREFIQKQYQLVKFHDRVGRMADTWEYSNVPFPKSRMSPELIEELRHYVPSLLEEDERTLLIRHLYIERRMVPLNLYIERATEAERDDAIREYGDAIKEMVAANIFPGDMLYKNFGVSRHGRVVFYDYDEVAYITRCKFRRIPPPRTPEDEMASEPWYAVGPDDVFPEEFGTFLLGDPRVRKPFLAHHADLLEPQFWQAKQALIREGYLEDVFPYPEALRLSRRASATGELPSSPPSLSDYSQSQIVNERH